MWIDLEAGGVRSSLDQLENWSEPRYLDGRLGGSGDLPDSRRPAARVPHAAGLVGRRRGVDGADRDPVLGRVSGPDGRSPGLGDRHPAVQRAVRANPGASATSATWRTSRSGVAPNWVPGSCWSTRCTPPSRPLRWSPRRTCRPPGGSRIRSTCGWNGSRSTPTSTPRPAARSSTLRAKVHKDLDAIDRIDRDLAWTAKRKALKLMHAVPAVRRPGDRLPRLPHPRGQGAGRLRDLVRTVRGPRAGLARVAGGTAAPRVRRGRGIPGGERRRGRLPPMAAVGAGRTAVDDPGGGDPGRHGAGRHARSRGRRAPGGIRFLGAAGRFRPGGDGRRAAGRLQPERAGLGAAAVAAGPAGRAGLRAVPGHGLDGAAVRRRRAGRPHHRVVPAVVDPEGQRADRGHLPALRPRGADRHPGAGGQAGPGAGGRRGSRHRRAVGAGLPPGAGDPRHVDPVVRVRVRRQRRAAAARVVAGVLPGLGDDPRPAADRRLSRGRSRAAAGARWGC